MSVIINSLRPGHNVSLEADINSSRPGENVCQFRSRITNYSLLMFIIIAYWWCWNCLAVHDLVELGGLTSVSNHNGLVSSKQEAIYLSPLMIMIWSHMANFNIGISIANTLEILYLLLALSHRYDISGHQSINSLWPSDAIWWHRPMSTLAQVMACCLVVPNLPGASDSNKSNNFKSDFRPLL